MDLVEYESGCRNRHPWELARFSLFLNLIQKYGSIESKPVHVLDVGSGDAWFASQLLQHLPAKSTITCWDSGYSDQRLLKEISALNPLSIKYVSTQPVQKYDMVLMLDVLEHVQNDQEFLTKIANKNMNPDSKLLLSVPTWQQLFSSHDVVLGHFRRYSPSQIRNLIEKTPLKVRRRGSVFSSLLLFRCLEVLKSKIFKNSKTSKLEDWNAAPSTTNAVKMILQGDGQMGFALAKLGVDFAGLSWWGICTKR